MRFMSWDGYHHHLGINLLQGRGAAPVDKDVEWPRRLRDHPGGARRPTPTGRGQGPYAGSLIAPRRAGTTRRARHTSGVSSSIFK